MQKKKKTSFKETSSTHKEGSKLSKVNNSSHNYRLFKFIFSEDISKLSMVFPKSIKFTSLIKVNLKVISYYLHLYDTMIK